MPSTYSLGPHFDAFIKGQLASQRYASASEVVRAGLRLLEEHEANAHMNELIRAKGLEWLQAEVQRGIDSPKVDGDTAMHVLKSRIANRNGDLAAHEAA